MLEEEVLISLLTKRYENDFVGSAALQVIEKGLLVELYAFAVGRGLPKMSKARRDALIFRAAYILEYVYFNYPKQFEPFSEFFVADYLLCENSSAKRLFSKMMADLLLHAVLEKAQYEAIGETTAHWLAEDKQKVAVKIWAMAVLKFLRSKVDWVDESWDDLQILASREATAAIKVRQRRGW